MSLIHNERVKLTASAVDRLSTAFLAVGVLGQVFALMPSHDSWLRLISIAGWLLLPQPYIWQRDAFSGG